MNMKAIISRTNVIIAIIGCIGVIASSLITARCSRQQPSGVVTTGNQNTIINSNNGVISINSGISKQEIIDALEDTATDLRNQDSMEREITRLKERLSKIHASSLGSTPEQADKWAESFVTSLPVRKDRIEEQKRKNKERNDFINNSIPYLFDYMIAFVDKRIIALRSHMSGIEITRTTLDNYFLNKEEATSGSPENITVREFRFPNDKGFKVSVQVGVIEKGEITKRPQFSWQEINCNKDCSKFQLLGECYGGFNPPACYLSFINDDLVLQLDNLNSTLTQAFDRLIENVLLDQ